MNKKSWRKLKQWQTSNGCLIIRLLSGRSNVFLCKTHHLNFMIDTSTKRNWKKLNERLNMLNVKRLDYLILTHSHYDHAENTNNLKKFYLPKVVVHSTEIDFLNKGENTLPIGTNYFSRIITKVFSPFILKMMRYNPSSYDISVESNYEFTDSDINIRIIHTPGHSRGSLSVIVDNEIALVGDTMFGVFKFSVYPPFAENTALLIDSWHKLLETSCSIFLPSHGNVKSRQQLSEDYNKRKVIH